MKQLDLKLKCYNGDKNLSLTKPSEMASEITKQGSKESLNASNTEKVSQIFVSPTLRMGKKNPNAKEIRGNRTK
ncbi:hypothetical protein RHMOL_Rhmol01G0041500 [Rhododendron molle]|uniref:Uncharacterized protein n=1 Tax=Rhododendron molle TaxID=49168 RepID=A0ACC0PXW4_RHOML|nr:hypothetical protein RHMOL_Rhmol01G0041500 [Rhododendron molle]